MSGKVIGKGRIFFWLINLQMHFFSIQLQNINELTTKKSIQTMFNLVTKLKTQQNCPLKKHTLRLSLKFSLQPTVPKSRFACSSKQDGIPPCLLLQVNLDLRDSIFSFLNRELFDLRKIYVVNLKTGCPKKCLMQVNLQVEIFLKSRVYCNKTQSRGL